MPANTVGHDPVNHRLLDSLMAIYKHHSKSSTILHLLCINKQEMIAPLIGSSRMNSTANISATWDSGFI